MLVLWKAACNSAGMYGLSVQLFKLTMYVQIWIFYKFIADETCLTQAKYDLDDLTQFRPYGPISHIHYKIISLLIY